MIDNPDTTARAEYNQKEGISPQLAAKLFTKSVPQGEIP